MGAQELIIILVILLLLFGARKLPELARSMGTSLKEFRRGQDDDAAEDQPELAAPHEPAQDEPRERRDSPVRD